MNRDAALAFRQPSNEHVVEWNREDKVLLSDIKLFLGRREVWNYIQLIDEESSNLIY